MPLHHWVIGIRRRFEEIVPSKRLEAVTNWRVVISKESLTWTPWNPQDWQIRSPSVGLLVKPVIKMRNSGPKSSVRSEGPFLSTSVPRSSEQLFVMGLTEWVSLALFPENRDQNVLCNFSFACGKMDKVQVRSKPQAISRRPFITKARIQPQLSSYGIYGR